MTNNPTEYMEPMTEEQIKEYSDFVMGQMSEKDIISKEGMDFITRGDNVPNEDDQQRILKIIEEKYNDDKAVEGSDTSPEEESSEAQEEVDNSGPTGGDTCVEQEDSSSAEQGNN